MIIKILNLNLWNYNNFGQRKSKIVRLIRKYEPDIVTFQGVYPHLNYLRNTKKIIDRGYKNKKEWYLVQGRIQDTE